jgi:ABC transporter substrate binding protein
VALLSHILYADGYESHSPRLPVSEVCHEAAEVHHSWWSRGVLGCLATRSASTKDRKIPRIGVLWANGPVEGFLSDALRQGLSQLGYIDGKTINLEHRFVGERYDRVDALAAELVESGVDILVVDATANAMAAKRATKTIPIVFVFVGDPVGSKLVDSLSHPGGNATGLSGVTLDVAVKEVEIFKGRACPMFRGLPSSKTPTTHSLHVLPKR